MAKQNKKHRQNGRNGALKPPQTETQDPVDSLKALNEGLCQIHEATLGDSAIREKLDSLVERVTAEGEMFLPRPGDWEALSTAVSYASSVAWLLHLAQNERKAEQLQQLFGGGLPQT